MNDPSFLSSQKFQRAGGRVDSGSVAGGGEWGGGGRGELGTQQEFGRGVRTTQHKS